MLSKSQTQSRCTKEDMKEEYRYINNGKNDVVFYWNKNPRKLGKIH